MHIVVCHEYANGTNYLHDDGFIWALNKDLKLSIDELFIQYIAGGKGARLFA